jgi:anti-sigma28 factor (negative regulator of flagellin synthesis)
MDRSDSNIEKNSGSNQGEQQQQSKKPKRPRSTTMLKMQWLAERVRKIEGIRKAVADGSYKVDSRDVARAMMTVRFPGSEIN